MLIFDDLGNLVPVNRTVVDLPDFQPEALINAVTLPNLSVDEQILDNWCWAATTAAIKNYVFGRRGGNRFSQAQIASDELGINCCVDFDDGNSVQAKRDCDVQSGLTLPLFHAECHTVTYPNPVALEEIKGQIDAAAPMCARVVWERGMGEGHFVVILGYAEDNVTGGYTDIMVDDSFFGPSQMPYEELRRYYRTTTTVKGQPETKLGLWTHSYYLKPPVAEIEVMS